MHFGMLYWSLGSIYVFGSYFNGYISNLLVIIIWLFTVQYWGRFLHVGCMTQVHSCILYCRLSFLLFLCFTQRYFLFIYVNFFRYIMHYKPDLFSLLCFLTVGAILRDRFYKINFNFVFTRMVHFAYYSLLPRNFFPSFSFLHCFITNDLPMIYLSRFTCRQEVDVLFFYSMFSIFTIHIGIWSKVSICQLSIWIFYAQTPYDWHASTYLASIQSQMSWPKYNTFLWSFFMHEVMIFFLVKNNRQVSCCLLQYHFIIQ